jgi:hypothetical protein
MKKNLLFISPHLPSLRVPQAGHKGAFNLLKDYSNEYNVFLVCFINSFESQYFQIKDYDFCIEKHFVNINRLRKIISVLLNPMLPIRVATRINKFAINRISLLEQENKFDLIHFEFTAAMAYFPYVSNAARKIVSQHDITYQSMLRYSQHNKYALKWLYYFEYLRFKKWELKSLSQVDTILTHNQKDRNLIIKDGISADKITLIKPYLDNRIDKVKRINVDFCSIIFWGAMNRYENEDAIIWFIKSILPLIRKKYNKVKLFVVGANPTPAILKFESEQIIVTGFVESPIVFFERATVAIAPLRLGAGIKIKVLECLKANIPVVSTSIGSEGIMNSNLLIADDSESFAEIVCSFLK